MCGIAGFFERGSRPDSQLREQARAMADSLAHRGPDDKGVWTDEKAGIALGFRRLAIIDLSPAGHQPMHSESGRYVITFNGEVYNYLDLRKELETLGHRFNGGSDTEVILASVEQWGLEAAVKRFIGMFAIALWDRKQRRLSLVRDRLGIKPLYYGWSGDIFLWGSELKALRAHPAFRGEIDRGALTLFLRHRYVPTPYSIYKDVFKLPPGRILTVDPLSGERPHPVSYWSAREATGNGITNPFQGSEDEAIEQLDSILRDAVRLRMIADVPLGAFLSGGIDSSTVVAIMQDRAAQPVKTYSIGFRESKYNEATHARAVAQHLQTNHTELYVTPAEARQVIPRLPEIYDEPFADVSQIPTFLVSKLARQDVTVSLSGDGGDELFGGYDHYFKVNADWNTIRWAPLVWRRRLGKIVGLAGSIDRHRNYADLLSAPNPEALYYRAICHWKKPAEVVRGGFEPLTVLTGLYGSQSQFKNVYRHSMYLDAVTYLPDDILTKVDRASSAVSLEARVPIIDHRVFEFAARLPITMKIRGKQGKWILRQVLYRYVPKRLIERPKMGFGVPIGNWLRGPLRDWAESLLNEHRLHQEGFLVPAPIRTKWAEHLKGSFNWQFYLWDVLMFQAWLEQQRPAVQSSRFTETIVL